MTRKINYDGKFIPPDEPEAIDAFLDAAYAHIPTSADVEQRDVELDHAVALERNRIADWLDDYSTNAKHRANSAKANHSPGIATTWETRARDAHNHAQGIRHGLHWRARG